MVRFLKLPEIPSGALMLMYHIVYLGSISRIVDFNEHFIQMPKKYSFTHIDYTETF